MLKRLSVRYSPISLLPWKKGDRLGLIGDNGCGKSTLLKVLDGSQSPLSGNVTVAHHCLLARVEQHLPAELLPVTLLEAVLAQIPATERESQRWRGEALLASMGLSPQEIALTAATLSGGQHTRLLLARALIREPDLLLLDEPGNHLDLPTLLWLEQFLQHWSGSFVMVSHDASLLDAVTNGTGSCVTIHCIASHYLVAMRALRWRNGMKATPCGTKPSKRRSTASPPAPNGWRHGGGFMTMKTTARKSQTDGKTG